MTCTHVAYEDGAVVIFARAKGVQNDNLLTTSNVSSLTYQSYDIYSETLEVAATSISTLSDAILDTPLGQADDDRWPHKNFTFNFRYVMPSTIFPTSGKKRVTFIVTDSASNVWPVVIEINVKPSAASAPV